MKNPLIITFLIFNCFIINFQLTAQPTIQWQKSLGGANIETALSSDITSDGGYILVGNSNSNDGDVTGNNGSNDYWVVKLDANGNIIWEKNYGGSGDDVPYSIKETYDKGYFVAGRTSSNDGDVGINLGGSDMWVLKLDSIGNIQWKKSLGGTASETGWDVQQTIDSGYVVVGQSKSNDGDVTGNHGFDDYWVVKLDGLGNIQWQKSLGGSQPDQAHAIQQTQDLGYIVVGESGSTDFDVTGNNGNKDYWIVKLDSIGNILWQKNYGGSSQDVAWSVVQTQDKGYIVVGYSVSNDGDVTGHHGGVGVPDYWVVKLDSIGNLEWQKSLGGTFTDDALAVKQLNDGGYIVAGTSYSSDGDVTTNFGSSDYWLVKLDSLGNILWQKNYGGSSVETAWDIKEMGNGELVLVGQSLSNDINVTGNHGAGDFWVVKLNAVVGINELEREDDLIVYPNPTDGKITLTTQSNKGHMEIFDLTGRKLMKQLINTPNTIIDLSSFAKGVYILRYVSSKEMINQKIILK